MRPEAIGRASSFAARLPRALAVALLALAVVQTLPARPAQSASANAPAYNAQSFVQELARLKSRLQDAGESTETLHAYRESLPAAWAVNAGGRQYEVPANLLVSRIEKAEKQPEFRKQQLSQAGDYLDALAAETSALSGQSPVNTDSARAKLSAILNRSEFAHARQETWWEKIRERINEMIYSALLRILRRVGGQTSLGYALLWIAVCAAVVLIAYWIFRLWSKTARRQEMDLQAAAVPSRSWQEWVFAAREAAGQGDYRMAVHCAYWAGIARLQDLGALAPDRAKTPREFLVALGKSKLLLPETRTTRRQALSALTARLERTWYGYHPATEADFRDSLAQLETLGCHLP
jgi:uncharacterized protein DUF4129